MFHESAGPKAIVCGIKRVGTDNGHGVTYYSTVDLRIFLGATDDYTADPIVWNHTGADYVETPPGLSMTPGSTVSWQYGVAVQMHGSTARLYVDRIFIGSITTFSSGIDTCNFKTPVTTEHRVGCIRWLQNSGSTWFDTDRLVGRPGEDIYYP